jgi:hypothetical protein
VLPIKAPPGFIIARCAEPACCTSCAPMGGTLLEHGIRRLQPKPHQLSDRTRGAELPAGQDRKREVAASDLKLPTLSFTSDASAFKSSDFFIVTVAVSIVTVAVPIDRARQPDLRAMLAASRQVWSALKKGDIVVHESTVYPSAIEEECIGALKLPTPLSSLSPMIIYRGRLATRTPVLRDGSGLVLDVKMKLNRASKPEGIELWRL